ncbi:hypothetical protein BDV24DRAFT_169569 [Aspergillus arachidicola]|uniref:DUF6699 domain-containing protein n=1 Tax=Aspergillus arachidicola TaxID=656916 RepID=A0A5N6XPD7_9EURO|nr:hypothetical protein BDV24DRAFT_169569 [Aspergillus arachidicola]
MAQSKTRSYKKLQIDTRWYTDNEDKLRNVRWNAKDPPEDARQILDNGDELEVNLSERVFYGPVHLLLDSRYGHFEWTLPITDDPGKNVTIRDVLQAIHDHIKAYEEACAEGDERGWDACFGMGDAVFFGGLFFYSTGVWTVHMGSC